ncbi:hypothetical protein M758_1G093800 [Ceratodon purpureus]|nr:hypothetical protein M758_1G093800 [Ceratodon purpureus]
MRPEHVEDAGRALFTAFYVDSLATGVPPTYNVASPEQGSSLLESFLSQPAAYKVVAVDAAGKVLGGACMQSGDAYVHAIGPLFVSPNSADRGVGKALMRSLIEHARKLNAPSIRLTTSAANRKSFCLYISLGFRPVECTSTFFGTVHPDAGECAAFAVGISTEGISTRKMEEADVKVCAEIYSKGMGYDREDDIKAMLTKSPERCWVATTEDNTILGYTTGLFLAGHTMTTSEAAWVAVVSRAIKEKDGDVSGISIPGVLYPRLIKWALAMKLVLARHSWYMVIGKYQRPKDDFYWSPSTYH